jgi:hypothetical protein
MSQFNGRLPFRAQAILKTAAATAKIFRNPSNDFEQTKPDFDMAERVLSSAHARVVRLYPEYFVKGALNENLA